eukprot:TRINITY_DN1228_c1_g3_i2.p1 TRINITY_DN1228_c1_g3~~TRINITY_DN1228_c1_g3_i2.p1  ORF type:complete len:932 (-),score=264.33 TRINITY_DN1228_c1_g3_i2:90-2885(-)
MSENTQDNSTKGSPEVSRKEKKKLLTPFRNKEKRASEMPSQLANKEMKILFAEMADRMKLEEETTSESSQQELNVRKSLDLTLTSEKPKHRPSPKQESLKKQHRKDIRLSVPSISSDVRDKLRDKFHRTFASDSTTKRSKTLGTGSTSKSHSAEYKLTEYNTSKSFIVSNSSHETTNETPSTNKKSKHPVISTPHNMKPLSLAGMFHDSSNDHHGQGQVQGGGGSTVSTPHRTHNPNINRSSTMHDIPNKSIYSPYTTNNTNNNNTNNHPPPTKMNPSSYSTSSLVTPSTTPTKSETVIHEYNEDDDSTVNVNSRTEDDDDDDNEEETYSEKVDLSEFLSDIRNVSPSARRIATATSTTIISSIPEKPENSQTLSTSSSSLSSLPILSFSLEEFAEEFCKACFTGDLQLVNKTVDSGKVTPAQINCRNSRGQTAIYCAARNGHEEIVKRLLEIDGIDVNLQEKHGSTPLHAASFGPFPRILSLLLSYGCDVNIRNYMNELDNEGSHVQGFTAREESKGECKSVWKIFAEGGSWALESCGYPIWRPKPVESTTKMLSTTTTTTTTMKAISSDKDIPPKVADGIDCFNKKWKSGLKQLIENQVVENEPVSIAKFFLEYNDRLNKTELGEALYEYNPEQSNLQQHVEESTDGTEKKPSSREKDTKPRPLLTAFTELLEFKGESFDNALRKYLVKFMLPGEAQKIDRFMEIFATKFYSDNPNDFPDAGCAFVLSFSLIMLNTDRHNPAVPEKDKMTKEQFIKNNRNTWNDQDPPQELLEKLYDNIINNEIQMRTKGDPDKKGWVKLIKAPPSTYEQSKRWMCLIGNELRWYKSPTLGRGEIHPLGKIVLDYVSVRQEDEDKFCITSALPQDIPFVTYDKTKEAPVECMKFIVTCENNHQMNIWMNEVRNNVTFNVEPTKTKFKKVKNKSKKKTIF